MRYTLSGLSMSFIASLTTGFQTPRLVEVCIAQAIATRLPVPTSEVKEPAAHFTAYAADLAKTLLSQINEIKIIDHVAILNDIRTFWMVRYQMVYPAKKIYYVANCDADEHFFGFASLLNAELISVISQDLLKTIELLNGFHALVGDMLDTQVEETPV